MKQKIIGAVMLAGVASPAFASGVNLLSGDTRLACEAILCLSSGYRPVECAPSLARYFGISHKKFSDTLNARRSFLNMCPAAGSAGMPSLVDALVNGAGRCDATELNRVMSYKITIKECRRAKDRTERQNSDGGNICTSREETRIRPSKPKYCEAYHNHEWTKSNESVRYEGAEDNGGRWVDVK